MSSPSRSSLLGADTLDLEETVDTLFKGRLRLVQHAAGYRFSLDALLLAAAASDSRGARVLDLGTGCGVVPLALLHWYQPATVVGLELQPQLVHLAWRNVEANGAKGRIEIVPGDVRLFREILKPQSFDVAICNPPYYPVREGRLNPDSERAVARHEIAGELDDFLTAAAYALTHRGALYVIYRADRLPALLAGLERCALRPEWIQFVHPRLGQPASLVLAAARRQGARSLAIRPPLVVHQGALYTSVIESLLAGELPRLPGDRSSEEPA